MVESSFISVGVTRKKTNSYSISFTQKKESIETAFDKPLTWERLDDRSACRIKCEMPGNVFDPDQWPTLIEFMNDAMVRMEKTFKEPLADINQQLQKREKASPAPTIS
jgi:hypothetical protein